MRLNHCPLNPQPPDLRHHAGAARGEIPDHNQNAEGVGDPRSRRDAAHAERRDWPQPQAEREQEIARLGKEQIAPQEIEKKRIEIAAEAEAEKQRREAQGIADATLAKYEAEAKGVQLVMEAKAEGYRKLIEACGRDPAVGPTLLLIEQLPKLVAEQVKAIQNLKIDKITVWDTGAGNGSASGNGHASGNGRNMTADWLAGMVGALPRIHELAAQAGIELPAALGKVGQRAGDGVVENRADGKKA